MKTVSNGDRFSDASPQLHDIRIRHHESRFQQLNGLLIGHSEGSIQYLLAVNGGGAVAMLGLVGAVEKWRIQNWPYWMLAVFVTGLILAGLTRAFVLIHSQHLVSGWIKDGNAYFRNQMEWKELQQKDNVRVNTMRWLPWTLGAISMLCFVGGTIAVGYLFFTLREPYGEILAIPTVHSPPPIPASLETGKDMLASTLSALIAAFVALIAVYCTQFLAESYRRFKDGSSIAAGLAGELASYKDAVPMLKKSLTTAIEVIDAGKGSQLRFRGLEKPKDRFFSEVVGKIGLLGPSLAERVIYVYGNLDAFRTALVQIHEMHKEMDGQELRIRLTACLDAMDRAAIAGETLTAALNQRSLDKFRPFANATSP